jgi:hypothetical protein
MVRWAGNVDRTGEIRKAYRILMQKTERKRPIGKLWCV